MKNIPSHFEKKRRTKLIYTNNFILFNKNFKNDVICSRYIYVSYKCKLDKWTKRNKPEWYNKYLDQVEKDKKIFYELIKSYFTVEVLEDRGKDPFSIDMLKRFNDDEKYLMMSEGRPQTMRWLILQPKK